MKSARELLKFWFDELDRKAWFKANASVDAAIRTRFEGLHHLLAKSIPADWSDNAEGTLAAIIALDQLPRNLYRGTAHAFATDGKALAYSRKAISRGFDHGLSADHRLFLYMPFQHSENLDDQNQAVELFGAFADKQTMKSITEHHRIIEMFGRFPHRNEALGRTTTSEERDFLQGGGATFGQ